MIDHEYARAGFAIGSSAHTVRVGRGLVGQLCPPLRGEGGTIGDLVFLHTRFEIGAMAGALMRPG